MFFQGDPSSQILAPVCPIWGKPTCRISVSFAPISPQIYSNERVWVGQIVGISFALKRSPDIPATAMHFGKRNEMINVQTPGICEGSPRVGAHPPARENLAL